MDKMTELLMDFACGYQGGHNQTYKKNLEESKLISVERSRLARPSIKVTLLGWGHLQKHSQFKIPESIQFALKCHKLIQTKGALHYSTLLQEENCRVFDLPSFQIHQSTKSQMMWVKDRMKDTFLCLVAQDGMIQDVHPDFPKFEDTVKRYL